MRQVAEQFWNTKKLGYFLKKLEYFIAYIKRAYKAFGTSVARLHPIYLTRYETQVIGFCRTLHTQR